VNVVDLQELIAVKTRVPSAAAGKGDAPLLALFCQLCRMARLARTVFASLPHHVTQRGNRREGVFFSDDDRADLSGVAQGLL